MSNTPRVTFTINFTLNGVPHYLTIAAYTIQQAIRKALLKYPAGSQHSATECSSATQHTGTATPVVLMAA